MCLVWNHTTSIVNQIQKVCVKRISTTTTKKKKWETRSQKLQHFLKEVVHRMCPPIIWQNETWGTSSLQPPPFPNSHQTTIYLLSEAGVNSTVMLMNGQSQMQSFPLNVLQNCTRLIGENNSSPRPSVGSSMEGVLWLAIFNFKIIKILPTVLEFPSVSHKKNKITFLLFHF